MNNEHLLLVDASGFAFRSYYTWPAYRRESDGEPVGAILGFMSMIWKMLGAAEHDKPTLGAAVFDAPGKNFRHSLFPPYKANRDPARALELESQLPIMRPVAEVLGLHPVEAEGFEADDVIATLAIRARSEGIRTTIVSSDKDFGQLVIDGEIEIVDPMQKARINAVDVERKFGVVPRLVPDVQALAGDPVDGYPGICGCGITRAAGLVRRFGSLDTILKRIPEVSYSGIRHELKRRYSIGKLPARQGSEWALLFRQLATLRTDIRLGVDVRNLGVSPIMKRDLEAILAALESSHFMEAVFGMDPQAMRIVPHVDDEFAWWKEELAHPGQVLPQIPQSGFYKRRLVHGGPEVASRIWREPKDGKDILRCEVGGRARDPFSEWVRLSMKPIPRPEYDFMIADAAHASKWRLDDPKANPHAPINILSQPKPTNPRRRRQA